MLVVFALGYLLGATLIHQWHTLPHFAVSVGVFCAGGVSLVLIHLCVRKLVFKKMLFFCASAALGWSWAAIEADKRLAWTLGEYQNQSVIATGVVQGVVQKTANSTRFELKLLELAGKPIDSARAVKVRLHWKGVGDFTANDIIQCRIKLQIPWNLSNPGSFDQEKQMLIEGIRALGRVERILYHRASDAWTLDKIRQTISESIALLLKEKPLQGILQAMTVGVRGDISKNQWTLFQRTGTSHLVAISGLHIGLVALLFSKLITGSVRRNQALTNKMPASLYGAWGAIISALAYAALAGFSIPTQRALIMIVVFMGGVLLRRPVAPSQSLALAWIGVVLCDPLATLQVGFWLSFGCVFVLILLKPHTVNVGKIQRWIMPQWLLFIALLPPSVIFFQQIPILSMLANMVAIPVLSMIVVPVALVAVACIPITSSIATVLLTLAHDVLSITWEYLSFLSALPWSVRMLGFVSGMMMGLAMLGVLLILLVPGIPVRWMGWFGLLPLFFYHPATVLHGTCRFTLLDVGQGLAALVQTQHHTLLFDAGPSYGQSDAGSRVIIPFLLRQGIYALDKVIISHGDLDHRAGLNSLQYWPLKEVITSEPARLPLPAQRCQAPRHWVWDGVQFALLSPSHFHGKNRNNLSCVVKITAGEHSILLTGDIEKGAEKALLTDASADLPSTILVVPHHGSATSSSPEFVAKVAPQYALYPVGLQNRYGFPKKTVLARYTEAGSRNLISYETGALSFDLRPGSPLLPPTQWRRVARRYWHARAETMRG